MENLKALIYKGDLTPYQRALAQREFEGMVERLGIYEKAVKNNAVLPLVSGSVFDTEELHTLHSGLIAAKPHLNKRTNGYMMVVAMIEKLSYLIREHYR